MQGSESDLIALLRALEGHADAKARGGAGAAASLARRGHLSAPTLGMIWDICGQVARELKGSGLPSAYDWCVRLFPFLTSTACKVRVGLRLSCCL